MERPQMVVFRIFAIVVVAATLLSAFAHAQGLGQKGGGGRSEYPVEDHPKVDEKAYKRYDPWSVVRPAVPAGAGRK
jgi:hypothetical protein